MGPGATRGAAGSAVGRVWQEIERVPSEVGGKQESAALWQRA